MPTTHCLPASVLAAGEQPVPPLNNGTLSFQFPSSRPYRGIFAICHGINGNYGWPWPILFPTSDITGGFFPSYAYSFYQNMLADGWILMNVPEPGDFYAKGFQSKSTYDYMVASGDKGAGYRSTIIKWWDHVVAYVRRRFGKLPILCWGGSWGGMMAFHVAKYRSETLVACFIGAPATIISNIVPAISIVDFTTQDTTGLDVDQHFLDNIVGGLPVAVQYGTSDVFVGWGIPGQGTCPSSGYTLPLSNTDMIIINGQAAGKNITRMQTADAHGMIASDVPLFTNWITDNVDPLAPKVFY